MVYLHEDSNDIQLINSKKLEILNARKFQDVSTIGWHSHRLLV